MINTKQEFSLFIINEKKKSDSLDQQVELERKDTVHRWTWAITAVT